MTKFGRRVTIVHRRDQLRAGPALIARASQNEKMNFMYNTVVTGVIGQGAVQAVTLQDTVTGAQREASVDGLFIYIGHLPNTALYQGQLDDGS